MSVVRLVLPAHLCVRLTDVGGDAHERLVVGQHGQLVHLLRRVLQGGGGRRRVRARLASRRQKNQGNAALLQHVRKIFVGITPDARPALLERLVKDPRRREALTVAMDQ